MSNKVVYVTGCLGFIGAYVTEACLEKGWHVIGVDNMTYASQPERLGDFQTRGSNQFKFIKSDINDLDRLHDCDYVINTAAETHVDNSIVSSKEFLHSNINGVHRLLELIRGKDKFRMPTLLHFSTDEVYGDIVMGAHKETDLLKPSNPYSATKAAADMLILAWNRTFKVPYVIVRPTNNYGIGQYSEKLIPKTCKLLQLGKRVPLHNNGTPRRIWLHAADTANAIIKIIESNTVNQIYNISGPDECDNLNIVWHIFNILYGDKEHWTPSNDVAEMYCDFTYNRDGQDVRYGVNDAKLKKLGWNPKKDLYAELPGIVNYYKNKFVW